MVLFFFYFPIKVAGGHSRSSRGKYPAPALNDNPAYAASVAAAADDDDEIVLLYCYVQTSKTKIPNHANNLEYFSLRFHSIGHTMYEMNFS